MADAYSNVVGGSLKLKGKGGKSKKRKHVDAEAKAKDEALDEDREAAGASRSPAAPEDADPLAGLTKAQRESFKVHERNMKRRGEEDKNKTYRDRISSMNEYLANLSEHNDVPRTSKT
ncbi:hypothetical protein T492DRAFT_1097474 [Pavlovales sp. CCMP2436]|nr:hypothetical protein T492DRAFT_1097474 [Pavlovales sp. CCMP2436]|mmetsp:Transcript_28119/g.70780  ORF Transcript_28119/g.70780 Transcript_28119/m.70780 type:complete len:118 (+) Transcript_28119:35-388(+)